MTSEETTPVEGVRLRPSDIKKLQVLALVLKTSVLRLIREAVEKHIAAVYDSKELRNTVNQMTPGPARSFLEQWMREAERSSKPARRRRAVRTLTPVDKHKL